jgi:hypothetical protein
MMVALSGAVEFAIQDVSDAILTDSSPGGEVRPALATSALRPR